VDKLEKFFAIIYAISTQQRYIVSEKSYNFLATSAIIYKHSCVKSGDNTTPAVSK
jgi:hypothetical protein